MRQFSHCWLILLLWWAAPEPCLASLATPKARVTTASSLFRDVLPRRHRTRLPHHYPKQLQLLLDLRGGQSADPNNYPNYDEGITYYNPPPTTTTTSNYNYNDGGAQDPFHETVQDRVEAWRNEQRQKYQTQSFEQQASPRDDQGRIKIMASVGKGSRALIFFMLMWRDIHHYEIADQAFKGIFRLIVVVPLVLLFVANLAGVVSSFSSSGHATKKRLKAILNLDKLIEAIVLVWSFFRLTVAPSKYIPKEMFISSAIYSSLYILWCQGFTALSW